MDEHFQSVLAGIIVLLTAGFLIYKVFHKKESDCGNDCTCSKSNDKVFPPLFHRKKK